MKNKTIQRGLSLLLVFCLLAGVVPCLAVTANAAEAEKYLSFYRPRLGKDFILTAGGF